ncbi:hypothetical protein QNO07_11010 [Streptomyces sp. 549]|uniref:hypothetical protein n=1 Tax=Streptomyces sp. 549 TaxID=3049076 RepID=UPI0024C29EFF|nr:hypothetical protein [Streptomyces sp. 549]MDK1473938.1 hypothetical protein [Streptomyces sp. 549]
MPRLLAAALTCLAAALLAVGTAFGAVALLNASPEQPNVPLVHFPQQGADDSVDGEASPDDSAGGSSPATDEE